MISGKYNASPKTKWRTAGSITTEHAALAVTGRDTATVDALGTGTVALISTKEVDWPYALLLRFRADGGNNIDSVVDMYAARGPDHYTRIATLTVVEGQQDTSTSTIHFVDTITPANEDALLDGEESNLTDMIAHYYVRTLGFDKFAFVVSDLDSTTLYIDYCLIYE